MAMTLQQLADRVCATLVGDGSLEVTGCAPIESAGPDQVTFLANMKYLRHLRTTRAAAVIVGPDVPQAGNASRLVAADAYMAFRDAMVALYGFRRHPDAMEAPDGVSRLAAVHPESVVGPGTIVHPFACIERGARVGARCHLYPGTVIGSDAVVGDECILFPNAVVYDRCVLGDRVTLHANTVVGHDGFGYATQGGAHHKIPQSGIVVIEDDVEIGAGCAIERAALGETHIGRGTKLADLISIGHGTRIGEHCLLVSLVGVSGSVEIGRNVVLGGQAGIVGHVRIGDGVQVAGRSAIAGDIPSGMKVGGAPAVELDRSKRNALVGTDLYGLAQRVRELERALARIQPELPEPADGRRR
jgi:UDP-3-O-[3-hydroxymyristoyl] glucosamine N-acyltransferase